MSLTPFARQQTRLNSAVLGRLADAQAVVGEGDPFGVLFSMPYAGPFEYQVDAAKPECLGASAMLGDLERGDLITIDGEPYTVERSEPDGTGMVRLILAEGYDSEGGE